MKLLGGATKSGHARLTDIGVFNNVVRLAAVGISRHDTPQLDPPLWCRVPNYGPKAIVQIHADSKTIVQSYDHHGHHRPSTAFHNSMLQCYIDSLWKCLRFLLTIWRHVTRVLQPKAFQRTLTTTSIELGLQDPKNVETRLLIFRYVQERMQRLLSPMWYGCSCLSNYYVW